MKKPRIYLSTLLCLSLLLPGCGRENDINQLPPANLRSIISFVLNPYSNAGNVPIKFTATINESTKIITLKLPKNLRLDSIRPEVRLSPYTTVSPINLEPIDLTKDTVEYTVTAESGKKAVYSVVKDMTYLYTNNVIYAVSLANVIDPVTNSPVRSTFWSSSVAMKVPVGTDKKNINVTLEMAGDSYNATIMVSEDGAGTTFRSFSNPIDFSHKVVFKSQSEDGKKTGALYTVTGLYN